MKSFPVGIISHLPFTPLYSFKAFKISFISSPIFKQTLIAAKYADRLIITSDNPRDEIPEAIIDDILAGLSDKEIPFDVVVDRTEAIYHSLKIAQKGDIIVLAGKGHEDYQVLSGNEHIHFDEREIVSEGLKLIN